MYVEHFQICPASNIIEAIFLYLGCGRTFEKKGKQKKKAKREGKQRIDEKGKYKEKKKQRKGGKGK